jgi:hypothetical protein
LTKRVDSGPSSADWLFSIRLNTGVPRSGVAFHLDASTGPASGTVETAARYFTWYRTTSLPAEKKTTRYTRLATLESRNAAIMDLGGSDNALVLYSPSGGPNTGIELNPTLGTIRMNNVTIQSSGSANRTLTVDADGAILTNASTLDAAMLGNGMVDEARLPESVTRLGATIELDSAETTGNLPWPRVGDKPVSLAGYLPADGEGRIISAIRILPQGDIPMLNVTP